MEVINKRRSVRQYKKQEVTSLQIEALLRAGMQAPSACNGQPWEFIVIQDKSKLHYLSTITPSAKMLELASVGIIVLGNLNHLKCGTYWQQDLGACTQNILLECVDQGLGACWIGVATNEERVGLIKEYFGLPKGIEPFAILSIGVPKEEQCFVERFQEGKVHYDSYK